VPSAASAAREKAWDALVAEQLTNARKAAENWRNGLIAMLALVTGFSLVKGPSDISGLDQPATAAVGILLLVAFVAAIFGTWTSLDGAYGTPHIIARSEIQKLGVIAYRRNLACEVAGNLRFAKTGMLLASLFLAAALGVTWYGPRTAAATVSVDRSIGPPICGKYVSSTGAAVDVERPNAEIVRILLGEVTKIHVVGNCP
jgi:hypothetical protein